MAETPPSHRDDGLAGILARPWAYDLFTALVTRPSARWQVVRECIRPFPGCCILEIGCGTAPMLAYLPADIGEYRGFDMNPHYVESARKRWSRRPRCQFHCQAVRDAQAVENAHFDIVLAFGILHHLADAEARHLFRIACETLKPGGAVVTYDNVYVPDQSPLARWIISKDRGQAVRTVDGYRNLAATAFPQVDGWIMHRALRLPYTIYVMRAEKP